jgi:chromatin remodeling complex protein RSC6
MAKKNQTKPTKQTNEVVDEVIEEVVEEKQPVTKKEKAPKKEAAPKKDKANKVPKESKTVVVEEEIDEDGGDNKEKKKRVAPTRDSVIATFDELISAIENEIEVLRDSSNKSKGIKFLRTHGKRLKTLKAQAARIISKRAPGQRKSGTNTSSGFLKPVPISKEMSKFTGWDIKEPKSRVDVTKFLCNYIRQNNLQNEKDKRQILPDTKLCKLLNYDPKTSSQPLTYFHLQSLLKSHFPKQEVASV